MRITCLYLFILISVTTYNQDSTLVHEISLEDAIQMATDSSLAAFKAKYLYQSSYWEYRSYTAETKPTLSLVSEPFYYTSALTQEYNSTKGIYEYHQKQTIYSYGKLQVEQVLPFSGGSFYVNTQVDRLQNFGTTDYTQFTTVPVKFGLSQPLFGFNEYKWKRKVEPLKYEKAKRVYLQSVETISLQVLEYYFDLLAAELNLKMAEVNLSNADTLYAIGMKRLKIASISQDEVLTLKINALSAKNDLAKADKDLQSARFAFHTYIRSDTRKNYMLALPDELSGNEVNLDQAMAEAQQNNPDLLDYRQQVVEAERDMDEVKREGLMDASLSLSYGLNQEGENMTDAYLDPLDQENISVSVSIQIIDWGQRKSELNQSKYAYEVAKITVEQKELEFQQKVLEAASNLNMQKAVVKSTQEKREVAQKAYGITKQRFLIGKTDVNSLTLALERQDNANLEYIESLREYWNYYYTLRELTLFNFDKGQSLLEELDEKVGLQNP